MMWVGATGAGRSSAVPLPAPRPPRRRPPLRRRVASACARGARPPPCRPASSGPRRAAPQPVSASAARRRGRPGAAGVVAVPRTLTSCTHVGPPGLVVSVAPVRRPGGHGPGCRDPVPKRSRSGLGTASETSRRRMQPFRTAPQRTGPPAMSSSSAAASRVSPPPTGCSAAASRVTAPGGHRPARRQAAAPARSRAPASTSAPSRCSPAAPRPSPWPAPSASATGSSRPPPPPPPLWTRGALRPMPKGHVMGVPGDRRGPRRSALADEGLARIERERDLPPHRGRRRRRGRRVRRRPARPRGRRPAGGAAARRGVRGRRVPHLDARRRPPALRGRPDARAPCTRASATSRRRAAAQPSRPGRSSWASRAASARLPLAVAEAVRARGGEIRHRDARRTGCAVADGRLAGPSPTTGSIDGRRAWSSPPPPGPPPRLLAAESPGGRRRAARRVEYASMALVTLAFRRADLHRAARGQRLPRAARRRPHHQGVHLLQPEVGLDRRRGPGPVRAAHLRRPVRRRRRSSSARTPSWSTSRWPTSARRPAWPPGPSRLDGHPLGRRAAAVPGRPPRARRPHPRATSPSCRASRSAARRTTASASRPASRARTRPRPTVIARCGTLRHPGAEHCIGGAGE